MSDATEFSDAAELPPAGEFSEAVEAQPFGETAVESHTSVETAGSENFLDFSESASRGGGRSDLSKQSFSKRTLQPPADFSDTDFPDTALNELEAYALHRFPASPTYHPREGAPPVRARLSARLSEGFTAEEIRQALDAGARLGHQCDTVLRSTRKLRRYIDEEDVLRARMLPAARRARVQSIAIDSYHAALENVPIGARFERVADARGDGTLGGDRLPLEQLIDALYAREGRLLDPAIWREATVALMHDAFWSARDPSDDTIAGESKRSATTLIQIAQMAWRERGWLIRQARRGRQIERVQAEEAEAARITEAIESPTRFEDTQAGVKAALAAWLEAAPASIPQTSLEHRHGAQP